MTSGSRSERHIPPSVAAAWDRVGRTSEARARWLLEFARRELNDLSSEEWREVETAVLAFAIPQGPWRVLRGLPLNDVRCWQRWVRRGLDVLSHGGDWAVDLGRRRLELAYRDRGLEVRSVWDGKHVWTNVKHAFAEAVMETLGGQGIRFRFCHQCARPFIARKRQAYCTPTCSQTLRTRKYRRAHPERVRQSRWATYARRRGTTPSASARVRTPSSNVRAEPEQDP